MSFRKKSYDYFLSCIRWPITCWTLIVSLTTTKHTGLPWKSNPSSLVCPMSQSIRPDGTVSRGLPLEKANQQRAFTGDQDSLSTTHSRLFLLWLSRHSMHSGETSKIGCSCCEFKVFLKAFQIAFWLILRCASHPSIAYGIFCW